MEEGLNELLKANLELSKENNKILHKMRSAQRTAAIMRAVYWLAIIGITVWAFYYLQPFIKKIMDLFATFGDLKNFLPR